MTLDSTPAATAVPTLRAATRKAPNGGVPSPCVGVCKMVEATGLCAGCYRTLDEIARWSRMGDADKLVIWQQVEARGACSVA